MTFEEEARCRDAVGSDTSPFGLTVFVNVYGCITSVINARNSDARLSLCAESGECCDSNEGLILIEGA